MLPCITWTVFFISGENGQKDRVRRSGGANPSEPSWVLVCIGSHSIFVGRTLLPLNIIILNGIGCYSWFVQISDFSRAAEMQKIRTSRRKSDDRL